jgi:hypothetical protein
MQWLLAKICTVCPLCIARRRWPQSLYGRIMRVVERGCPFCRAYDRARDKDSPAAPQA